MKVLVVLSALLALGSAQFLPYGYPYAAGYSPLGYYSGAYNYAPATYRFAPTPYAAVPAAVSSQYHAQDELGQFNYGYADGLSTKNEYRRFDGATVGSYSYVDANGKVQTVSYTADDVNGFRVHATNLPVAPEADLQAPVFDLKAPVFDGVAPEPVQDTAEVAAAKAEFRKAYAEAAAAAEAAPDTDAEEAPKEESSERRRRSAVLLPAVAKATFKTASLDKVEADTPADTTLLKITEKEHEAYVPAPVTYAAAPAITYAAAPAFTYAAPVVKKVEVKHVATPITYAAAPAITYTTPVVKKVEVKHVATPVTYAAAPLPLTYGLHPYGLGAPLIYNFETKEEVAADAEEKTTEEEEEEPAVVSAERRRRSAVLLPAVAKATFKTASLDKVEADTPADTTLLEITEKEHETYVPAPVTYAAAPAFTYAAAPAFTYAAAPLPLTYGLHPYGLGAPLIYSKPIEEKAE